MKKRYFLFLAIAVVALCLSSCRLFHVHDFSNGRESKKPTCTEPGERKSVCDCGEMLIEPIEATGHRFINKICKFCHTPEEEKGPVFHSNGDGTCAVSYGGFCTATRLEIPTHSPDGDRVTTVKQEGFRACTTLVEVIIPETVTHIESSAFYGCTSLKTVRMANSVTHIGSSAFFDCTALHDIVLSEELLHLGDNAFRNCTSLAVIYIPQNPISIGAAVFHNTAYYNKADNWEEGVLYLDAHLLSAQEIEATRYVIKEGTVTIAGRAFAGLTVGALTIPTTIEHFGTNAFDKCNIGFFYAPSLEQWCRYTFATPASNPIFGAGDVYFAEELLTDLVVPAEVTVLNDYAFIGYNKLCSVTFHKNVTRVGLDAFRYCEKMEKLYFSDMTLWYTAELNHIPDWEFFYVNENYAKRRNIRLYLNGEPVTHLEIPDEIEEIWAHTFGICETITSITLPEGSQLRGQPYWHDENIRAVYYKGQPSKIDGVVYPYQFFSYPKSIYYFTEDAPGATGSYWCYDENGAIRFWHICTPGEAATCATAQSCTECRKILSPALGHVYEQDNACTVCGNAGLRYALNDDGTYTVVGIVNRTDRHIHIPSSHKGKPVTAIGENAFKNCGEIRSVIIAEGIRSIEASAFYGCAKLVKITVPDSVSYIGTYAFFNCSWLEPFDLPESLTVLGMYAFVGCRSLTSFIIPEGITVLGGYTFSNCNSLRYVVLPKSLVSIGKSALAGCESLSKIYYHGTAEQWEAVFINGKSNTDLTPAIIYYYSETRPTEDGNYWHWVDGVPTAW